MGADLSKSTHAVIVKFSLPRSSSGVLIVVGFFWFLYNKEKSKVNISSKKNSIGKSWVYIPDVILP